MIKNWISAITLVAIIALTAGAAQAVRIDFAPDVQSAPLLDTISVDIVVSELGGNIVSGYGLGVLYDASVLQATSASSSGALGVSFPFFDIATLGFVDLFEVSLFDDLTLLLLQGGDSIVLATIEFLVIGAGASALEFDLTFPQYEIVGSGLASLSVDAGSGLVNPGSAPVPEPNSGLLFAAGFLVAGSVATRRRAKELVVIPTA